MNNLRQSNEARLDPHSPERVHRASSVRGNRREDAMNLRKLFNMLLLVGAFMPLLSAILVGGWIRPILEAHMGSTPAMILGAVVAFSVLVAGGIVEAVLFIAAGPHPQHQVSTARLDGIRLDVPEVAMQAM